MAANETENPPVLNNLSPQSLEVLLLAVEQALALKHACVASEHLLLGLVGVHTPARDALVAAGLDFGRVFTLVKDHSKLPQSKFNLLDTFARLFKEQELPLNQDTNVIMEIAKEKSLAADSKIIEPNHLLLAILDLPDCTASQLLARSNINIDQLAARLQTNAA